MRLVFPILALAIAALSAAADFRGVSPGSLLRRFDQLYATGDAAVLLNQDASNPSAWCTYAELLALAGRNDEAAPIFEQAVRLGPSMPAVLMRAADFEFARGHPDRAIPLTRRILEQTPAFDQVLFSLLLRLKTPADALVGNAIPAEPRPARSWLAWLRAQGSAEDLEATWSWMRRNQLAGGKDAVDLAQTLWERGLFSSAQSVWADWIGATDPQYLNPQRLANRAFEREPAPSPFDWTLSAPGSVELARRGGLDLRFSGTENVSFSQVRQFATVSAGLYEFAAEIASDGLTTDQRPLFHIFDAVNSSRLDVETAQAPPTAPRSWMRIEFRVPPGMQALVVRIERRPSARFDRNIAGSFHVYRVSLKPLSD
jgi:tetratricopeptide (TPR) repeat protein